MGVPSTCGASNCLKTHASDIGTIWYIEDNAATHLRTHTSDTGIENTKTNYLLYKGQWNSDYQML